MTVYEIPVIAAPQTLSVTLAGTVYNWRMLWNAVSQVWMLDIYDANFVPLALGIALVAGRDLFAPYAYLNLGGQLVVQTDNDVNADPTYTNLGLTSHLFYIPTVQA